MGSADRDAPLLLMVDCVTIPVPDLDAGIGFYCTTLGHRLAWRNDAVGQAGLETPDSQTEIVLTLKERYEPAWKVESADAAVELFRARGGSVLSEPSDFPVGRVAVVEDPFGNRLVLLDLSKGLYQTDADGNVTGVA